MYPAMVITGSSSHLNAKKDDGGLRLCIDYQELNKATIKNRYPLPLILEMLERLHTTHILTKLDLGNAYHFIQIKKMMNTSWHSNLPTVSLIIGLCLCLDTCPGYVSILH